MGATKKEHQQAMTLSSPAFPPQYKCKSVEKVGKDLYIFRNTIRTKKVLKKNRNMIVLRHNRVLTLVNAVRLTADGERLLRKLGTVRHIIRLGPSHGAYDDEYYINAFSAQLWSPGLSIYHPELELSLHHVLKADSILPIPKAHLFMFKCTKTPEAAMLLKRKEGNLLVTSEALQCQVNNPLLNMPTRTVMQLSGMLEFPIVVSPKWIKSMSRKKVSLRNDFERLLKLDFSRHVGSTGSLVGSKAKERVVIAVEMAFPVW